MKKILRALTCAIMCMALLVYTTPLAIAEGKTTSAVSKDESVYVLLGTDGSVQKQIVSNWLHADGGVNTVIDQSSLTDIMNLKGELQPTQSGSGYVWDTTDTDVFYQGNTDTELPIALEIDYKLDGQSVAGEELAGKTGRVEIHVKVKNQYQHTQTINGVERTIAPLFLTAVLIDMPVDNFSNITTDNGYILNESNTQMVGYATVPGLKDSFEGIVDAADDDYNLSSITDNFSDEFTVCADAVDFELPSIMAVAASDSGVLDSDINAREDLDKTLTDLSDLTDATVELTDGTSKLSDAAIEFDDSMAEFKTKIDEFKDGMADAKSGAGDLKDGANKLADGASSLASGAGELADGADTLNTGVGKLSTGAKTLASGAGSLSTGAGTVLTGAKTLSVGASTLYTSLSALQTKLSSISSLVSDEEIAALANLAAMLPQLNISEEDRALIAALPQTVASIPTNMAQAIMNSLYALNGDPIPSAAPTQVPAPQHTTAPQLAAPEANAPQTTAAAATVTPQTAEPTATPTAQPTEEQPETPKQDDAAKQPAAEEQPAGGAQAAEQPQTETQQSATPEVEADEQAIEQLSVNFDPDMLLLAIANETRTEFSKMDTNGGAVASGKLFTPQQMAVIEKVVYAVTANTLQQVSETMAPMMEKLNGMLNNVDAMAAELAKIDNVEQLLGVAAKLPDIVSELNGGVAQLTAGAKQLSDGANALVTGCDTLSGGADKLSGGANSLVSGIGTLSNGASALSGGANKLSTGANTLYSGAGDLSEGAGDLADGLNTLNDAAGKIGDAVDEFKDATTELKDSTAELDSGAQEYKTDGIDALTERLEKLIDSVEEALDVKNAIVDCTDGFTTYTGAPQNADTTVKFLFKTPAIKLDDSAKPEPDSAEGSDAKTQQIEQESSKQDSMWDKLRNLFR